MNTFAARIAASFEDAAPADRLYEVIETAEGVRIASTTSFDEAERLADALNIQCSQWADRVGADAVLG